MMSIKRSLIRLMSPAGIIPTVVFCLSSCGDRPPNDPCCRFSELPQGLSVKAGDGALQVEGTTGATFYVLDAAGKQLGYAPLNGTISLNPGAYQLKINNSLHAATVRDGELTRCSTGTLLVKGQTQETYYVLDTLGTQLSYERLEKGISLFASTVQVKVNNTVVRSVVEMNQLTEVQTGTVIVHGTTGETYYMLDGATGQQLSYHSLEAPLALLPGTYTVKLNNTSAQASIAANRLTEFSSGTLVVHGTTDETYYILDATGTQLAYHSLEKPLAFLPGSVNVKLNNTRTEAAVAGGQLTELQTGPVLVKGLTDETYYVFDPEGNQLAYQSLNKSLSFFPGRVGVRINKTEQVATVSATRVAELVTGAFMLTGSGSDTYYVLDLAGSQLAYQGMNKSLSFFPGEYTVKYGKSTRKIQVSAGKQGSLTAF